MLGCLRSELTAKPMTRETAGASPQIVAADGFAASNLYTGAAMMTSRVSRAILTTNLPLQELKVVSGVTSPAAAVSAAYARYDRAAGNVVAATDPDGGDTGDIAGAIVQMDQSKIQVTASLLMMRKSNDMLASMLNLFDYGAPVEA